MASSSSSPEPHREGLRHVVECNCFLPQDGRPFRFVVFSTLEDDVLAPHLVRCPACDAVHRILDIGKSVVLPKSEGTRVVVTLDDVKASLPQNVAAVLEKHDVDLSRYQQALFIVENSRWGEHVVLSDDTVEGRRVVKYMRIIGPNLLKVEHHEDDSEASW